MTREMGHHAGASADAGGDVEREVDCPRCHQTCGWCGDYRWMHGQLTMPGTRRYCKLTEVVPEGADCPLCAGTRRVTATVSYAPTAGPHLLSQTTQDDAR